jgi:hypothetical protein
LRWIKCEAGICDDHEPVPIPAIWARWKRSMKFVAVLMALPACAAGPVQAQDAGDPLGGIGVATACFTAPRWHAFVRIASFAIKSLASQTRSP